MIVWLGLFVAGVLSLVIMTRSWLLGSLDIIYTYIGRVRRHWRSGPRFFEKGFGEEAKGKLLNDRIEAVIRSNASLGSITIDFNETPRTVGNMWLLDGQFLSNAHEFLHDNGKTAFVQMVTPKGKTAEECSGLVVHMAATGDEFFGFRRRMVAQHLAEHNIASLLLMVPGYGKRRYPDQKRHYISMLDDYSSCATACILEGAALLEWSHATYPSLPLGITGISYGGAMASGAAILAKVPRFALVSCVGSATPAVLVTGALKHEIGWQHLLQAGNGSLTRSKLEQKLLATLGSFSIKRIAEVYSEGVDATSQARHVLVHCVVAANDHFVSREESELLQSALSRKCVEVQCASEHKISLSLMPTDSFPRGESKITFVPGGHVSTIALARWSCVPSILRAMSELRASSETKLTGANATSAGHQTADGGQGIIEATE